MEPNEMTTDEKALATLRAHGYEPYDCLADDAVKIALAPYLDQHPDGSSVIEHRPTDCWEGMVSEMGNLVYHPTAYLMMQNATDPKALTDREVVFLVMTCEYSEMYTKADWDGMVAQQIERSQKERRRA